MDPEIVGSAPCACPYRPRSIARCNWPTSCGSPCLSHAPSRRPGPSKNSPPAFVLRDSHAEMRLEISGVECLTRMMLRGSVSDAGPVIHRCSQVKPAIFFRRPSIRTGSNADNFPKTFPIAAAGSASGFIVQENAATLSWPSSRNGGTKNGAELPTLKGSSRNQLRNPERPRRPFTRKSQ